MSWVLQVLGRRRPSPDPLPIDEWSVARIAVAAWRTLPVRTLDGSGETLDPARKNHLS